MNNSNSLTLSKKFPISAARLFTLLSSPGYIEKWFSPHETVQVKVIKHDFKVGGHYNFEYTIPGGQPTELHGKFLTIEEPTKISFSWQWQEPDSHAGIDSTVTWILQESNNQTTLTVIHEGANNQFYERHQIGWNGSLSRLATLATSQ